MKQGIKFDSNKLQWHLLPMGVIKEVVRVLMKGAKKYSPDNWKVVPNARERYYNAALRHITAWHEGSPYDSQTKISHLAHAMCCLIFLRALERRENDFRN